MALPTFSFVFPGQGSQALAMLDAWGDDGAVRRTLDEASEALRSGQPRDAWTRARPLFTAYPDVYTVQDLRCQIAMKLGLAWDEASAQCERLMELTATTEGAPKR